jgi:DNA-binding HxlR family transcriptional regulator
MVVAVGSMRSYGDGCTSAHALDLVGERWALLIVRDLLLGPKRFSDLHAGLPQSSPNVVTQRLRELEAAGVVRRGRLPPPASANVYELTEWGAELEPIVLALQRWGAASPSFAPGAPIGCDAAMLALKNAFDGVAARGGRIVAEVRFTSDVFRVTVADDTIDISRGAARDPDVTLQTDPATLEELVFTGLTVGEAERADRLGVTGDRDTLDRFLGCFAPSAGAHVT